MADDTNKPLTCYEFLKIISPQRYGPMLYSEYLQKIKKLICEKEVLANHVGSCASCRNACYNIDLSALEMSDNTNETPSACDENETPSACDEFMKQVAQIVKKINNTDEKCIKRVVTQIHEQEALTNHLKSCPDCQHFCSIFGPGAFSTNNSPF